MWYSKSSVWHNPKVGFIGCACTTRGQTRNGENPAVVRLIAMGSKNPNNNYVSVMGSGMRVKHHHGVGEIDSWNPSVSVSRSLTKANEMSLKSHLFGRRTQQFHEMYWNARMHVDARALSILRLVHCVFGKIHHTERSKQQFRFFEF